MIKSRVVGALYMLDRPYFLVGQSTEEAMLISNYVPHNQNPLDLLGVELNTSHEGDDGEIITQDAPSPNPAPEFKLEVATCSNGSVKKQEGSRKKDCGTSSKETSQSTVSMRRSGYFYACHQCSFQCNTKVKKYEAHVARHGEGSGALTCSKCGRPVLPEPMALHISFHNTSKGKRVVGEYHQYQRSFAQEEAQKATDNPKQVTTQPGNSMENVPLPPPRYITNVDNVLVKTRAAYFYGCTLNS